MDEKIFKLVIKQNRFLNWLHFFIWWLLISSLILVLHPWVLIGLHFTSMWLMHQIWYWLLVILLPWILDEILVANLNRFDKDLVNYMINCYGGHHSMDDQFNQSIKKLSRQKNVDITVLNQKFINLMVIKVKDHWAVFLTQGLLDKLSPFEIDALLVEQFAIADSGYRQFQWDNRVTRAATYKWMTKLQEVFKMSSGRIYFSIFSIAVTRWTMWFEDIKEQLLKVRKDAQAQITNYQLVIMKFDCYDHGKSFDNRHLTDDLWADPVKIDN